MLVIDPLVGTDIHDACRQAARVVTRYHSHTYRLGTWYAFSLVDGAVIVWTPTTTHHETFWEYLKSIGANLRDYVETECKGDKPGVCLLFNEIELICTDLGTEGKTEGAIAYELVSQYEAKHQARYDAYWTPERRAEEAEKMREHAKEMKQRQERIDLAQQAHPFQPSNPAEYSEWRELNSNDGYSRGAVIYMEAWAALMEAEIAAGKSVTQAAEATQNAADVGGITGFMYGCARSALAAYWHRGSEFKRWSEREAR